MTNRRITLFVIFCGFVIWYIYGDTISKIIDREMVRHARFDPKKTEFLVGTRPDHTDRLVFPKGKWVKAGQDVLCYGRALGHHKIFGFRSGYSYVKINGKMYEKSTGPCSTTQHIYLNVDALDSVDFVTEDVVVRALKKDNYYLIP